MKEVKDQNLSKNNINENNIPIEIINNMQNDSNESKEEEGVNINNTDNFVQTIENLQNELNLLKQKNKELEADVIEVKDKRLRSLAEFENYKRRSQNELSNFFKYSSENFIKKILPIHDDLQRSLLHIGDAQNYESFLSGIRLVFDKFTRILEDEGVKKMETKARQFDFNFHEALLQQINTQVPNNTILEEIESGYMYKDKVIRHAKVIVSQQPEESKSTSDNPTDESQN
ncbi:MAG: nucleotide exchange factor GrpE [bacterium]